MKIWLNKYTYLGNKTSRNTCMHGFLNMVMKEIQMCMSKVYYEKKLCLHLYFLFNFWSQNTLMLLFHFPQAFDTIFKQHYQYVDLLVCIERKFCISSMETKLSFRNIYKKILKVKSKYSVGNNQEGGANAILAVSVL